LTCIRIWQKRKILHKTWSSVHSPRQFILKNNIRFCFLFIWPTKTDLPQQAYQLISFPIFLQGLTQEIFGSLSITQQIYNRNTNYTLTMYTLTVFQPLVSNYHWKFWLNTNYTNHVSFLNYKWLFARITQSWDSMYNIIPNFRAHTNHIFFLRSSEFWKQGIHNSISTTWFYLST
jgi:hypothetical protein